jgi:hypothetical protein
MALGDGIRRNIAKVSQAERDLFIDAIIKLHTDPAYVYPGGVTYWGKQDEIHQATHVHGGPAFMPWHRELCNRFEELLRLVHPELSLHYWDWTTDPRNTPDGQGGFVNLFTPQFMGGANGAAGAPLTAFTGVTRNVNGGPPPPFNPPGVSNDNTNINAGNGAAQGDQYSLFDSAVQGDHNGVHPYIGGTIGPAHTAFEDPFVFLLHSNVDRLFAQWQMNNNAFGNEWRLLPGQVYGNQSSDPEITENLEPWAGGTGTRPWTAGDGQIVIKNSKHPSVVKPTCYDSIHALVDYETLNVDFGNIPEELTSFRAARIKVKSCHKVKFRITQNPTGNFALTPMGTVFTYDPKTNGVYGDAFVWIQFTAIGTGLQTTTINVQAFEDLDTANPHNIGAEQTITFSATPIARINNSVVMVLDRSGSMGANAGGTSTRSTLMKTAVGVFATLMRSTDEIGLVSFDDLVATLLPATVQSSALVQVITILVGNGLDPRGATGIGIGIQEGNTVLAGANALFNKTMLVLTDGNENVHPYVNELLPGTITAKTFAIGFGLPAEVSAPVLNQITNNTNGDLIVTGNITTEEQRFLLTKYFVQVLNGINNNQIILDPQGNLLWGAVHHIPFIVSEADVSLECIALCPVPLLLSFKLETPDGKIIDPSMSGIEPNIEYVNGKEVAFYRIMLPALPASAAGSHAGTWKAVLQIKSKEEIEKLLKQEKISIRELAANLRKTLPYNFMAQCYSNLVFTAKSIQTSLEPGAIVKIEASLKEYDVPVANRASITALVTKPDLNTSTIALKETEPGFFETEYKAAAIGNYSFRLIAKGNTIKGRPFTREKTVTAGVFIGGDKYNDNNNFSSLIDLINERDRRFCELLNCIFSQGVLNEKLEKRLKESGIDLKHLRECLKKYCYHRKQPEGKARGIDFGKALADPAIMAAFDKMGADFILNDETFGFAKQPVPEKKDKKTDRKY